MSTTGPAFDHVLIIMFENQYRSYVMNAGSRAKDAYPYVIKHNPFSSFANVVRNGPATP